MTTSVIHEYCSSGKERGGVRERDKEGGGKLVATNYSGEREGVAETLREPPLLSFFFSCANLSVSRAVK